MSAPRTLVPGGLGPLSTLVASALAAALVGLPAPRSARAQDVERYMMVATRGADTLSVERVTRSPQELGSEILVPGRARLAVAAALGPEGCVTGATVDVFPWGSAAGATPVQHVGVRQDGDSLRVDARARDVAQQATRPAPGVRFVMASDSWAASAMVVECALALGDSASLRVAAFPGLRVEDLVVVRRGRQVTVAGRDTSLVTLGDDGRADRIEIVGSGTVIQRSAFEGAVPAPAKPDYAPPPGAGYRAEDVSIPVREGVTLAGTLTLPSGSALPAPAVVLVSGGGAQDRDSYAAVGGGWRPFRELAHALTSRGVAVLRFDDRGVGASTGDFGSATEREGLEDVKAVVAFLRGRSDVAGARIALLGHSEGARVAMWAAAEDGALAGLVLLAGAADPRGAALAQARWQVEHTPGIPPSARDSILHRVERQLDSLAVAGSREAYRWDAPALAHRIRVPVAAFQGGSDKQVPPEQADSLGALFRAAGNADVTVRVFPDLNHLFVADPSGDFLRYGRLPSGALEPSVLDAVGAWVTARLGVGPASPVGRGPLR
ncbi:MAG TPA: alpha/beta hydrolase [Longimicrobiales bacterium]|nr:alpha/beta hydrolase [Longimicrobiales bacterium]